MEPFRTDVRVRYEETDQGGVVYHANYFRYFEVGRTELLRREGIAYRDLEREGTLLVVVEASARYHAPGRYDDVLTIETRVASAGRVKIEFEYAVRRAGEQGKPLVTGATTLACIGRDGGLKAFPEPLQAIVDRLKPPRRPAL